MEKSSNKFKMPFIVFYAVMFFSIQSLLILKINKILKYKRISKQKSNKKTKILSLVKSSNPITLEELIKTEKAKYFINAEQNSNCSGEGNFTIEYVTSFCGCDCEKRFIFHNNKLKTCNYIMKDFDEISGIQQIYEKIADANGVPDEIKFDKEIFLLQYVWHGKNGVIVFNKFY